MTDLTILDGNVDDVKGKLAGLDAAERAELLTAEKAGKNRKGVTDALEEVSDQSAPVSTGATVDTTNLALSNVPGVPDTSNLAIDTLIPATQVAASGAFIEPTIVERIDTAHPAVDNEPRKGQPKVANLIDFNDPHASSAEAVSAALGMAADPSASAA